MTPSLRLSKIGAIGLALAWTVLSFGAVTSPSPASAAKPNGVYYTAELARPAEESRAVAGGVAWACQGTTCVAGKGTSRPLRVCRELQRELGPIASFTAKGEKLDAEKLARCNG